MNTSTRRAAEQMARKQYQAMGVDAATVALTGMDSGRLKRHLSIAGELLAGRMEVLRDGATKRFLYEEAARTGTPRHLVDRALQEIAQAPSGEAAARRYAAGVTGDARAAEEGLSLARHWVREDAVQTVGERLSGSDIGLHRSGFHFEDRSEYEKSRADQGAVRDAIRRAMVTSGVAAPEPRTLGQMAARAQGFSDGVADRLERREVDRAAGKAPDLRTELEDAFDTDRALRMKHDVGMPGPATLADVRERADAMQAQAASLTDIEPSDGAAV